MSIDFAGNGQIISGGNNVITITTGGQMRLSSSHPMFTATANAISSSLTPIYNTWTVYNNFSNWGTTRWIQSINVGNCLNTSNGRFTAPVTGTYLLNATTQVDVKYSIYTTFFINNSYQPPYTLDYEYNAAASGYVCYRNCKLTVIRNLSAGDTVELGGYFASSTYSPTIYCGGATSYMGLLLG